MVLGEKVSLMETPLQESSNKTLRLLVCMQLNKQGPRALVRKVIRITFPRTLKHSFPLKTDRELLSTSKEESRYAKPEWEESFKKFNKRFSHNCIPHTKKKGIFQQFFQPVPPKITLFEIFLSLSLSFVLNLEMNQARGNALQLRRTDFVFFWTTLLKEKVEKISPIYNK